MINTFKEARDYYYKMNTLYLGAEVEFEKAKTALDQAIEDLEDARGTRNEAYALWRKFRNTLDFEAIQAELIQHVLDEEQYAPFNDTIAGMIRTTKDPDTLEYWADACGLNLNEFCKES